MRQAKKGWRRGFGSTRHEIKGGESGKEKLQTVIGSEDQDKAATEERAS